MNRLCKRFEHIGRLNMNFAGVSPFSWKMLMPGNVQEYLPDTVRLFCEMDDANVANLIEAIGETDGNNYEQTAGYDFVAEAIANALIEKYGSLDAVYPSIVRYLFVGDQADKQTHKQMFWRVFGFIAVNVLEINLRHAHICPLCGMKTPVWAEKHHCPKAASGFVTCCDCGKIVIRTNSRQKRCAACQDASRRKRDAARHKDVYDTDKAKAAS